MIGEGLKLAISDEIFLDLNDSICGRHYEKVAAEADGKCNKSSQDYTRLITSLKQDRPGEQRLRKDGCMFPKGRPIPG